MDARTRIDVDVVRSTKNGKTGKVKAYLVSDGTRQGWVKAAWLRADGTVSAATFAKAAARRDDDAAKQATARAWRDEWHAIRVDRETERAIATDVTVMDGGAEQAIVRALWFPKRHIRDGKVPGWLIQARVDELMRREDVRRACGFLDPSDAERLLGS